MNVRPPRDFIALDASGATGTRPSAGRMTSGPRGGNRNEQAELRELAFNRASLGRIREAATRAGMRDLLADGKIKILRGDTTPGEVARFAQADTLIEANIDI